MNEVFHKVDVGNFSELRQGITNVLEKEDLLHIQCLNDRLNHLSRGQLMSGLDAMERDGLVEIRKAKQDLFVSLA